MLKIFISTNTISPSWIEYNDNPLEQVDGLPQKLAERVIAVATVLGLAGITVVKYDNRHLLLSAKDGEYSLNPVPSFLNDEFIPELIGTIKLLDWFLGPHLSARDPDRIGGPLVCSDCHQSQPQAVSSDGFCKNPFCSSHAKWAEIIDGHITPENKFAKVFPILDITHPENGGVGNAVEDHKKLVGEAFKGIPRTGAQNEWLEKANEWAQEG